MQLGDALSSDLEMLKHSGDAANASPQLRDGPPLLLLLGRRQKGSE